MSTARTTNDDLPTGMTVDEFLAWADGRPGRYELFYGQVYAMSPERARHAKTKFAVQTELARAIRSAGVSCDMLPDGMTIRISDDTAFEPDGLVYCGPEIDPDSVEVANPVIVVEVLSRSTRKIDTSRKIDGYFSIASVHHYLVVDPERRKIVHHQRQSDGTILTRLIAGGTARLDPPGLDLDAERCFA
jgi:Uma2 family endonuclease